MSELAVAVLATAIGAITIGLILARPGRLPEPAAAAIGAGAMLVLGLVSPRAALLAVAGSWNVFLFFLGLMVVAVASERAGVFDAAAHLVGRLGRGSARRLLVMVYLLGVVVTAFLSNDATALLLTPVVFSLARRLKLPPLPYAYACVLSANAASFILPVANPANLLVLAGAPMSLWAFVRHLWLPSIAANLLTLGGLLALTWTTLGQAYVVSTPEHLDRRSWLGMVGLLLLVAAYLGSDWLGVPLGVVACAGGLLLTALDTLAARFDARALLREVPWGVLVLLAGLTVVVEGLVGSGVTGPATGALDSLAHLGRADGLAASAGAVAVAVATAILSNVVNNLPLALIVSASLGQLDPMDAQRLAAGAVVGIDLGPNLTTVGAFSTMLWVLLLRRRGLDVSPRAYARVGLLLTPPALVATLLALALAG
jgi:arsenical pump membrane protein